MNDNKTPNSSTANKLLQYLKGGLDDDERYDLEAQLERNPALLDTLRELMRQPAAADAMQEDLSDIAQRWQQQRRAAAQPPAHNPWWSRVAAAVLCLAAAWAAYHYYIDQSDVRLYASYFDVPNQDQYIASRSTTADTAGYAAALSVYDAGDYKDSYYRFKRLAQASPFDGNILLYKAHSAMQLGDYAVARLTFEQMLTLSPDTASHAAAHWYLALIHLRDNRPADARTELQWLIDNPDAAYTPRAIALLQQMKS